MALAANPEQRRSAYRELFRTSLEPGLVDQLRIATSKGIVFGNDRFRQEIETATGRRMNTTRGRPPK
jgi:putative transposase